jgi:glycosyltransferase involved in cell wall biosynthesis
MNLVSVILASNKVDAYFFLAIKSIQEQSFKHIELIIVLNGLAVSKEAFVRQKLSQYPNVKIYSTEISGLNFSLNLGINNASGLYIARMDADDISYTNRISTQFEFLELNPDIALCGSFYDEIDAAGSIQSSKKLPISNAEIRRLLAFKNPICHPTVMFRKDIVCRIGAYLNGEHAEDYDLWVRLSKDAKVKFVNIPKSLLGYRVASLGEARRSKVAYASKSSTQWCQFILSGKPIWFIASIMSFAKAIFFAKN